MWGAGRQEVVDNHDKHRTGMVGMRACWAGSSMRGPGHRSGTGEGRRTPWVEQWTSLRRLGLGTRW